MTPEEEQLKQPPLSTPAAYAPDFSKMGSGDLGGTWQKLYDAEAAKTAKSNAANLGAAQRQASQQAALAGYNPLMASRLQERAMAGAYSANQQANEGLTGYKTQLQEKQRADDEKYLEGIKEDNPAAHAAAMNAMFSGKNVEEALRAGDYLNPDGTIKAYSKLDQEIDQRTKELDGLNARIENATNPNEQATLKNMRLKLLVENVTPSQLSRDPKALDGLTATEKTSWALGVGLPNFKIEDYQHFINQVPEGMPLVYGGILFMKSSSAPDKLVPI